MRGKFLLVLRYWAGQKFRWRFNQWFPWGNLCIFYRDFRYSEALIRLGHVESGLDILTGKNGNFKATLDKE